MSEMAAIEAVRAVNGPNWAQAAGGAQPGLDPNAVSAFEKAMGTEGPGRIPFVSQVAETWRASEVCNQNCLQTSVDILGTSGDRMMSVGELTRLQYELQTAGFHLEVTTIVAKKVSDAVSTLVKNG